MIKFKAIGGHVFYKLIYFIEYFLKTCKFVSCLIILVLLAFYTLLLFYYVFQKSWSNNGWKCARATEGNCVCFVCCWMLKFYFYIVYYFTNKTNVWVDGECVEFCRCEMCLLGWFYLIKGVKLKWEHLKLWKWWQSVSFTCFLLKYYYFVIHFEKLKQEWVKGDEN